MFLLFSYRYDCNCDFDGYASCCHYCYSSFFMILIYSNSFWGLWEEPCGIGGVLIGVVLALPGQGEGHTCMISIRSLLLLLFLFVFLLDSHSYAGGGGGGGGIIIIIIVIII